MPPDAPDIRAADVERTAMAIGAYVAETPTQRWQSEALTQALGRDAAVFAKLELFQHTGTFKVRGAFHVMLHLGEEQRGRGITAISAGNHAIAAAYAARELGTSAKVVMLAHASPARLRRCRSYGAEVVLIEDVREAFDVVHRIVEEEGRALVHPFEGVLTSLGTATVGMELCRQAPGLDAVVVPIGGGGLASGVATAVKLFAPDCAVYGVEPVGAPTMTRAFEAGESVEIGPMDTIADSLAAPFTGPVAFSLCRRHVDDIVLVTDDELRAAQALAFADFKLALEPAGAAATAALLGPLRERLAGQRVGVVVCGTNIDVETFAAQVRAATTAD